MSVKLTVDAYYLGTENENPEGIIVEVNGKTVGECLNRYIATRPNLKAGFFDRDGALDTNTFIFINKIPIISNQLMREVKDGDEIRVKYNRMHGCPP
jgi:hypothetical protein